MAYSQCCGSGSKFFHPGSRVRKIPDPGIGTASTQKLFLSSGKYDPGCSSRIQIPDLDLDLLTIPDATRSILLDIPLHTYNYCIQYISFQCLLVILVGQWADPSGTAMLGQPATKPEQAPELHPLTKISLISKGAHGPRIRY